MRGIPVVILFIVAGLAGCAESPEEASLGAPADMPTQPFQDVVQERPALLSVPIQEKVTKGTAPSFDLDGEERGDHQGTLSYHGLGEIHDEWGRKLVAHTFRYDPLVFIYTDITFNLDGTVDIDGDYEVGHHEFYFDAADGRFMGLTDLDSGVRSFAQPGDRVPFAWGYINAMFPEMIRYMHGDIEHPVVQTWGDYTITSWLEPYAGERRLAGTCDMYIDRHKWEGPEVDEPSKPDPDPYEAITCIDERMVPVWYWAGNTTEGSFSMQRQGQGLAWPSLQSVPLPPAPFDAGPMEAIPSPLPGMDPIYTPPSDGGEDYARIVRDRVEALHLGAPYIEYKATRGPTYAHHVTAGWPPHAVVPLLGNLIPPGPGIARFSETSWVMVHEEDDYLWAFVHTLELNEGTRFVTDPDGVIFQDGYFPYPTREELGDVVKTASVRGRVPDLTPEAPRFVSWAVGRDFGSPFAREAWWSVASHCFEVAEDPRFLMFDGIDGHLLAAGAMYSHPNGCSMGGFKSALGPDEVQVFPATSERPFPVVLDARGELAVPLGPDALAWIRQNAQSSPS